MLSLVFYDGKYQKTKRSVAIAIHFAFFLFVATFHIFFLSFLTKNEGSVPSGDEDVIHRLVACYLCFDDTRYIYFLISRHQLFLNSKTNCSIFLLFIHRYISVYIGIYRYMYCYLFCCSCFDDSRGKHDYMFVSPLVSLPDVLEISKSY
jgi:hypothetical protein